MALNQNSDKSHEELGWCNSDKWEVLFAVKGAVEVVGRQPRLKQVLTLCKGVW
jgi:hypothetical protein